MPQRPPAPCICVPKSPLVAPGGGGGYWANCGMAKVGRTKVHQFLSWYLRIGAKFLRAFFSAVGMHIPLVPAPSTLQGPFGRPVGGLGLVRKQGFPGNNSKHQEANSRSVVLQPLVLVQQSGDFAPNSAVVFKTGGQNFSAPNFAIPNIACS